MSNNLISTPEKQPFKQSLLLVAGAALFSFGLTMLLMSGAYLQDLSLLQRVPEAVWLFVCGVPTDNEMVLPLMIGLGSITLLVGVGLAVLHIVRRRRGNPGM
jgi:hypothetical protein